jgi:hypothetical protein
MICEHVLKQLGFECELLADDAWRLWTPFTYGDDGELIGLYVNPVSADAYQVTDYANTLYHGATLGIEWTPAKLRRLRTAMPPLVDFHHGEIRVLASTVEKLPAAVVAVMDAVLMVSYMERESLPRSGRTLFTHKLDAMLMQFSGERLRRNVKVVGASGRQMEFPYLLVLKSGDCYIQPVSSGKKRPDWDAVYRAYGKMTDLKEAGAEQSQRCIIVDDSSANQEEMASAITFLSGSARVLRFSQRTEWLPRLAA